MVIVLLFTIPCICRWSIQHEPSKKQQSVQAKSPLPDLTEGKELSSNSSSEISSQHDEDLTMDKKRSSTSSTQVRVAGYVFVITLNLNYFRIYKL